MRVGFEALDVDVSSDVRDAVSRTVSERLASSVFAEVQDLRLRLHRTKGALLCVAVVGFVGGDLVTSTATSDSPLGAIVDALDRLPGRIGLAHRTDRRPNDVDRHAAVREELKRLLDGQVRANGGGPRMTVAPVSFAAAPTLAKSTGPLSPGALALR
jgi:hypothetical protein